MVCVNYFSIFQELRITWELHNSEILFILTYFIDIGTLFFSGLWQLTFPEQAVNIPLIVLRLHPIVLVLPCEWRSLTPGSVKISDFAEKDSWFTCRLLEQFLMAVLHRVKPGGVISAKKNTVLWQSACVCSCDWQVVLHRIPVILGRSVVWLWSTDIVIGPWKVLFDYLYMKAVQKCLLIQSIKTWAEKLADKLVEYGLCTHKLLNFHWTCILRIDSFSKRKIQ